MSTPTLEFPMPYGATLEARGSQYTPLAKPHPRQRGSAALNLLAGPCRVAVSWADNPTPIDVRLHDASGTVLRILGTTRTAGGWSR